MAFKNFRFNVVFRIIIFMIILSGLTYCLSNELYLRSVYIGVALILAVVEFVRYVDKSNRDLTSFLIAILQDDFTSTYSETAKGESFTQFYRAFNRITSKFRTISEEKAAQFLFLEMLIEHVRVGILSIDQKEQIHLINDSMKKLLSKPQVHSLKGLENIDKSFVNAIRSIQAGENRLVKIVVDGKIMPLTIHASEFTLQNNYYKLISAQDIHNELEANEIEAWQKLIKVLTHEIMNSISPVMSLSSTLHQLIQTRKAEGKLLDAKAHEDLEQGLEAIRLRSEALQNFTKAYRSLTRVPQPQFRTFSVKDICLRLKTLLSHDAEVQGVEFRVSVPAEQLTVSADPELIEQVLINVIKNSLDALQGVEDPYILLEGGAYHQNIVSFRVKDNGLGISKENLDKIFIPFFTTKKNGSGIGLALSKQIVQLHRGQFLIESEPGVGTTVEIRL